MCTSRASRRWAGGALETFGGSKRHKPKWNSLSRKCVIQSEPCGVMRGNSRRREGAVPPIHQSDKLTHRDDPSLRPGRRVSAPPLAGRLSSGAELGGTERPDVIYRFVQMSQSSRRARPAPASSQSLCCKSPSLTTSSAAGLQAGGLIVCVCDGARFHFWKMTFILGHGVLAAL